MGTEVIKVSFDVLQEELDKAKSTLKGLNDNIRRISGREPPEQLRLVYRIFLLLFFFNFIVTFEIFLLIKYLKKKSKHSEVIESVHSIGVPTETVTMIMGWILEID